MRRAIAFLVLCLSAFGRRAPDPVPVLREANGRVGEWTSIWIEVSGVDVMDSSVSPAARDTFSIGTGV